MVSLNGFNGLVFVIVAYCVYCEVGLELSYIIYSSAIFFSAEPFGFYEEPTTALQLNIRLYMSDVISKLRVTVMFVIINVHNFVHGFSFVCCGLSTCKPSYLAPV